MGFTLAELLIALAILGVIATFTIPKIITTQQNSQYNAIAKEAASMLSAAHAVYQANSGITSSTKLGDLTQYLNYVGLDNLTVIDEVPGYGTKTCGGGYTCLKLHSGGILMYKTTESFGGTGTTNVVWTLFDPDGQTSAVKGVSFYLYYTGHLSSSGVTSGGVSSSSNGYTGSPSYDPPWFNWSQ